MGETTKIEWADSTFNFWTGCTKVSRACDHCYAESWAKRTGHPELWAGERRRTSVANWRKPLIWDRNLDDTGRRQRVFTNSLADFFDNQVPEEWRADAWATIGSTANLDWLILTKRPQNIAKMLPKTPAGTTPWPWPNVWLGTTAENQEEADRRIPHLLAAPAAKRFLSCEPLLGAIDLMRIKAPADPHAPDEDWVFSALATGDYYEQRFENPFGETHWDSGDGPYREHAIDWVIAGGESGPGARPMRWEWASWLRDQCSAAGVPFFFKQWGEFHPTPGGFERRGKKAAGRLLDGVTHDEMPHANT